MVVVVMDEIDTQIGLPFKAGHKSEYYLEAASEMPWNMLAQPAGLG